MSENSDKIVQNFLGAMEIMAKKAVDAQKYDKTVTCTIVKNETDINEGQYLVKEGGTQYRAFARNGSEYNVGQSVQVTIPNADYANQKIILNKIFQEKASSVIHTQEPFDTLVRYEEDKPLYSLASATEEKGTFNLVNRQDFSAIGLCFDAYYQNDLDKNNPKFNIELKLEGYQALPTQINNLTVDTTYLLKKFLQNNKKLQYIDFNLLKQAANSFEKDKIINTPSEALTIISAHQGGDILEENLNNLLLNLEIDGKQFIFGEIPVKFKQYDSIDLNIRRNVIDIDDVYTYTKNIVFLKMEILNQEYWIYYENDLKIELYEEISRYFIFNETNFLGNLANTGTWVPQQLVWDNNKQPIFYKLKDDPSLHNVTITYEEEKEMELKNIYYYTGEVVNQPLNSEIKQCVLYSSSPDYYYSADDKKRLQLKWFRTDNGVVIEKTELDPIEIYWFQYRDQQHSWPDNDYSPGAYWKQMKQYNNQKVIENYLPISNLIEEKIMAIVKYDGKYYNSNILTFENKLSYYDDNLEKKVPCFSFGMNYNGVNFEDDFVYRYNIVGEAQCRADYFLPFEIELQWLNNTINNDNFLKTQLDKDNINIGWTIPEKYSMYSGKMNIVDQEKFFQENKEDSEISCLYSIDTEEIDNIKKLKLKKELKLKKYYSSKAKNNSFFLYLKTSDSGGFFGDEEMLFGEKIPKEIMTLCFDQTIIFKSDGENHNELKPQIELFFDPYSDDEENKGKSKNYINCFSLGTKYLTGDKWNEPFNVEGNRTYGGESLQNLNWLYDYYLYSVTYDKNNNIVLNDKIVNWYFSIYDGNGKEIRTQITTNSLDTFSYVKFPNFTRSSFQIGVSGKFYKGAMAYGDSVYFPYFYKYLGGSHLGGSSTRYSYILDHYEGDVSGKGGEPVSDVIFSFSNIAYYNPETKKVYNKNMIEKEINIDNSKKSIMGYSDIDFLFFYYLDENKTQVKAKDFIIPKEDKFIVINKKGASFNYFINYKEDIDDTKKLLNELEQSFNRYNSLYSGLTTQIITADDANRYAESLKWTVYGNKQVGAEYQVGTPLNFLMQQLLENSNEWTPTPPNYTYTTNQSITYHTSSTGIKEIYTSCLTELGQKKIRNVLNQTPYKIKFIISASDNLQKDSNELQNWICLGNYDAPTTAAFNTEMIKNTTSAEFRIPVFCSLINPQDYTLLQS